MSQASGERREWVVVGRVRAARGLRGELRVEVTSDHPDRFAPGQLLFIDGRPFRIERSASFKEDRVVKLEEVDSREAAQALRGRELSVPPQSLQPLPEDTYYHYHLLGMDVFTRDGGFLGRLVEILPTGGNDVYVVRRGKRQLSCPPWTTWSWRWMSLRNG